MQRRCPSLAEREQGDLQARGAPEVECHEGILRPLADAGVLVFDVHLDGLLGDEEQFGHLPVPAPAGDEPKDLNLARGQGLFADVLLSGAAHAPERTTTVHADRGTLVLDAGDRVTWHRRDRAELDKWVQAHAGEQGGQANPFAEMEATMSQKMMAATGADADQTWARKMIEHHQGSIDMSKRVLQDAKDPEIRRMAQKTIDMQTKEIAELQSKLGG